MAPVSKRTQRGMGGFTFIIVDLDIARVIGDRPATILCAVKALSDWKREKHRENPKKYSYPDFRASWAFWESKLPWSEDTFERAVKCCEKTGALLVRRTPRKKGKGKYHLHYSINDELFRRLQAAGKREEGQPAECEVKAAIRKLRGAKPIQPARRGVEAGSNPQKADLSKKPCSSSKPSSSLTHTRAELAALVPSGADRADLATLGPTGVCSSDGKNSRKNDAGNSVKAVKRVSRSASSDQTSSNGSVTFSHASVVEAWRKAVASVYGNKYPATNPNRYHVRDVIRFCEEYSISPIKYVRWFVAKWDYMKDNGKTSWMKLAAYPVFDSIANLIRKALPFFIEDIESGSLWENRLLSEEEKKLIREKELKRQEEERCKKEEEARKHPRLYIGVDNIIPGHPLTAEITERIKSGQRVAADWERCTDILELTEEWHDQLVNEYRKQERLAASKLGRNGVKSLWQV